MSSYQDLLAIDLYGRVRLDLHNKQSSNYFNGWILSKDVQYLETLASEVKNEK